MKKFTVSFFTALVFLVVSVSGTLNVSAYEDELTASISMEEYLELEAPALPASEISIQSNEDYSYYDMLDDNNKAAYDQLKSSWLEPNESPIQFTLADSVSYETESTDMSTWTEEQQSEFWNLIFSTFQSGLPAFQFDHPEVFWFDDSEIEVSVSTSTSYSYRKKIYTITVSKVKLVAPIRGEFSDAQSALEAQDFLSEQINNLEIEGSDYYSKLKFMHDYISHNVTYNIESPFLDTAYGMFVSPNEFVCEGYSEAFKLMCDREGIPCISVVGNVEPETGMAHMWNYVMMEDGQWYGVDCTWDDLDSTSVPVKYQYFLKGSESYLSNHTPDDTYITPGFVYPELCETDYVYSPVAPIVTQTTTTSEATTTTITTTAATTTTPQVSVSSDSQTNVTSTEAATVTTITVTTTVSYTTSTEESTTVPSTTQPEANCLKGDFNQNGILDIADIIILQKKLIKAQVIQPEDYNYELNNDNLLNVWDYVILLRQLTE